MLNAGELDRVGLLLDHGHHDLIGATMRPVHSINSHCYFFGSVWNHESGSRVIGDTVKVDGCSACITALLDAISRFTYLTPGVGHPGFVLSKRMKIDGRSLILRIDAVNNGDIGPELRFELAAHVQVHRVNVVLGLRLVIGSDVCDELAFVSYVLVEREIDEQVCAGESRW